MKYIFSCGGTAGHIYPAIAIANYLKNEYGAEILFIGSDGNMECSIVPENGFDIKTVSITNLSRSFSIDGIRHNACTIRNVLVSASKAKKIIKDFSPDAVIGTGGYVCYPVLLAANKLGIPTVVHESNAYPGLTTRMTASFADRILVGVRDAVNAYSDKKKVIFTGTPVREEFNGLDKDKCKTELGINSKLLLSFWGSLGSGYMNDIFLKIIPELPLDNDFRIIHVTGKRYFSGFMEKLKLICPDYEKRNVEIVEFIPDIPRYMAAADLICCRAGASTLSELCYIGKPSVLVPSPNVTNNHQEKNARVLEWRGAAKVMLESEFDSDKFLQAIGSLISDDSALNEMSECSKSLANYTSVKDISGIIISLKGK